MLKELLGYMATGALSTILDLGIFSLLTYFYTWNYEIALTISWMLSATLSLYLNNTYVFSTKNRPWWRIGIRFYCTSICNLLLNQFGMFVLVTWLGFQNLIIGRLIVLTSTFLINFTLVRNFVFIPKKNKSYAAE